MIVVDTNILVYAIVNGPQTASVHQVLAWDSDWAAPDIWRIEFVSAVTTLVRGRAISASDAESAIIDADRLMFSRDFSVNPVETFRAAQTYDLSAYDAQFVTLARNFGIRLLTADRRVLRNASSIAISPADFLTSAPKP